MGNNRVLIICNCSSGLNEFRGMLIDKIVNIKKKVYAVVPISNLAEELEAEKQLVSRGCKLIKVEIDRRSMNPFSDIKLFMRYKRVLKEVKPEMVITYTIKPNVYGGIACRLANIPYAINITGLGTAFEGSGFLRTVVTILNKLACKKARVVFFENEENRQVFVCNDIVKEEQTHRLNGAGVDLEKYQISEYPRGEKIRFLFMGRVMAEKGINELFEAMKKLISEKVNCELIVLGGYEEDYKDIIEKNEAEGWLQYMGYQTDVRPYIEACHCFVLPSWHEGMANTILESAASGRPVITSNIHGCMEAVHDGYSGLLCEPRNIDSLYQAMKKIIGMSYTERKYMGLEGRKIMEELFDKAKVVDETMKGIFRY